MIQGALGIWSIGRFGYSYEMKQEGSMRFGIGRSTRPGVEDIALEWICRFKSLYKCCIHNIYSTCSILKVALLTCWQRAVTFVNVLNQGRCPLHLIEQYTWIAIS